MTNHKDALRAGVAGLPAKMDATNPALVIRYGVDYLDGWNAAVEATQATLASVDASGEGLDDFTEWLAREMPPGTVISDPRWWAPRIARRLSIAPQGHGGGGEAVAIAIIDHRSKSHNWPLDTLPNGTLLYTTPPTPSAPVVDEADGWEANVRYLLDSYPGSIRVRPGGGSEDLIGSLAVTFIKLRDAALSGVSAPVGVEDTKRLDWLEANEYDLSTRRERAIDDEYLILWFVTDSRKSTKRHLHSVSGHPLGSPREAIDAARLAAESPPAALTPPAAKETKCIHCGEPTMHVGNVCFACSQPAAAPRVEEGMTQWQDRIEALQNKERRPMPGTTPTEDNATLAADGEQGTTVADLAKEAGVKSGEVLKFLHRALAMDATVNQRVSYDIAGCVVEHFRTQPEARGVEGMVNRFLCWKLPDDFAPDAGVSFTPGPHQSPGNLHWPVGTNLLTAVQARAMLEYVLNWTAGAPSAQQPLDGPANITGVATGSRNGPPSESVTRGSPPSTLPPAPAAEHCEAVELTKCCGREECGGECGNEWRGMEWVRKATQPKARGVDEVRRAVADYMWSEGCSCCRDSEAHEQHERRLAELLGVPPFADGSGFDFQSFRTAALAGKEGA